MKAIPTIGPMAAIGLGTWKLTGKECERAVKSALDIGYRHLDTADYYKNHGAIGAAIQGLPRDQLFIVSKIMGDELLPRNVAKACERFLMELKSSYLDLLLIHWPVMGISSVDTLKEMVKLKERGLIKHLGVSNFSVADLEEIEKYHFPILTNQVELHPYLQEADLLAYCKSRDIIVTAYSPLQQGEICQEDLLIKIGQKHHKTASQITLRWLFQRGIVSIPKASSHEHLLENITIFDFSLSDQEMAAIKQLDANQRQNF